MNRNNIFLVRNGGGNTEKAQDRDRTEMQLQIVTIIPFLQLAYWHPHLPLYLEQEAFCKDFIQKCGVVRNEVAVVKYETM